MNEVLVDTGPLVAYLDRSDFHHPWAKEEFQRLTRPLLTCEAVVAEFLIRDHLRNPWFVNLTFSRTEGPSLLTQPDRKHLHL